jgi:SAM-dependent methyltransferase
VDHYSDEYWNDLPGVLAYMCRRSTGDPHLWWMDYVKTRYATTPRRRALVIGCGNGWVERDLYDRGVALEFDAFDASAAYLEQAEAQRGDRPIFYRRADFATFVAERQYDLVVNVAALHHARFLYRHLAAVRRAMTSDGVFVNWDYVGPSRNQYPRSQVALMNTVNERLPERFRTPHPLAFPLHAILPTDPTEAVHSAEILGAVSIHFDFAERHDIGGGIAYQVLWNNINEFRKGDPEATQVLRDLLALDEACTDSGEVPVLFSFFVCRPRTRSSRLRAAYHERAREPARERMSRHLQDYYPTEFVRAAPAIVRRRCARLWEERR